MHRISRSMHAHIEVNIENVWEELTKDLDSTWRRTQNDPLPNRKCNDFIRIRCLLLLIVSLFLFSFFFFSQIYDRSYHRFSSLDHSSHR